MSRTSQKNGYILLTCEYYKEGRNWVATCRELGTSTFARTLGEAEKRLQEAMELHLETLENVGEMERFFEEHHIVFSKIKPQDFCINIPAREDVYLRPCILQIGELVTA